MMTQGDIIPDLKDKWLQDLVEKVAHRFNSRKEMEILTYEIGKTAQSAENLHDRLTATQKRFDSIMSQIHKIPSRIAARQAKLKRLRENRIKATRQYEKLKDQKRELERRLEAMPKMQADINRLLMDVGKLTRKLRSLRSDHSESLTKKEACESQIKSAQAKIDRIEEEINISKNTKELLLGSKPDQFDADVFEEIQSDVEKNVESFETEMTEQIEKLKVDLSSIQAQLDEKTNDKQGLIKRKEELLAGVKDLKKKIGEDIGKEDLVAIIENLTEQQNIIKLEAKEKQIKTRQEKEALNSTEKRIKQEDLLRHNMSERHSHLTSVSQEMAGIENVAQKITSLGIEIQKLQMEAALNRKLGDTVKKLHDVTDPINQELRTALEYYARLFSDFEREIERL